MGVVTYVAWKADLLVLGDIDGNINLWDLKGKLSRCVCMDLIHIQLHSTVKLYLVSKFICGKKSSVASILQLHT